MDFIVRARWWVASPDDVIEHGAARVRDGRIVALYRTPSALSRAQGRSKLLDFGDAIVAPGMINAHAHLELSGLRDLLPRGPDFAGWIRALLMHRGARGRGLLEHDARTGADRALATGTTTIADIETTGAAISGLRRHPLRIVFLREVLDAWFPDRTAASLARVRRRLAVSERRSEGFSPHAPFTVSADLMRAVSELALSRRAPVQMHWSETPAEVEWLLHGLGPLAGLLGPSPRRSALDVMRAAGLLRTRLALVHGNCPSRGEPTSLARAGVTLVHCPGSHAWFEREPFPWSRYAAAGVSLALGTDSWASNEDLDLRREMRLVAEAHPKLSARALWSAGTLAGARWLGRERELGVLTPGAQADWFVLPVAARSTNAVFEALVRSQERVEQTWIGGRRVYPHGLNSLAPASPASPMSTSRRSSERAELESARAAAPRTTAASQPARARRSNGAPARSRR